MKTESQTSETTETSIPASLSSQLDSAMTSVDTQVSQGLQNLQLVQKARLSGLSRTAATLKAQYGAADARVVSANAAVAATTSSISRIAMIYQQQTTPAPAVAANGWALHGRVFTSDLQPAADLTVFLVDGQKTYQQKFGFAYTDSSGYFILNFPGDESRAKSSTPLYVQVVNQQKQPIYLASSPFQPTVGTATYQNTTLPAKAAPLGDPPAAIRRTAFPNLKKRPTAGT